MSWFIGTEPDKRRGSSRSVSEYRAEQVDEEAVLRGWFPIGFFDPVVHIPYRSESFLEQIKMK